MRRERHTARTLWEMACPLLQDSPQAYLIVADSVLDKRYAEKIDLLKRQYRGTEHGLVRGIGVVNLVHSTGQTDDFHPIDDASMLQVQMERPKTTMFGRC
ncbi:MAG: hypothetical protein HC837_10555 [Chloroflexaceae bacterium]|nr:hypothetical protein [Chloroflexaceae bacterium]